MPREIKNPFPELPGYRCFGCDPGNHLGLRMKFYADDEKGEVFTTIKPEYHFSGFPGILHGGIQTALIDEVAFWTMFDKVGKIALTMKMEMEFLITVGASSWLEVRGKIESVEDRIIIVNVGIFDERKKTLTRGKVLYYIPKRNRLLKILGKETFPEKLMKYVED